MLKPIRLRADYSRLSGGSRSRIIASRKPILSWGGNTSETNDTQSGYQVIVKSGGALLWDSGEVVSDAQFVSYAGEPLPTGKRIEFCVRIANGAGFSQWEKTYFYCGSFKTLPDARWICASQDEESVPVCFRKDFSVKAPPSSAALFVCGLGYHEVTINGRRVDASRLDPAVSDYTKSCYYAVIPEVEAYITPGDNCIGIAVADGWRRNNGRYLNKKHIDFFGPPCLWAALRITHADGAEEWILSDDAWQWGRSALVKSHLFDGETYDARHTAPRWDYAGSGAGFYSVRLFEGITGALRPMTVEPVLEKRIYEPVSVVQVKKGVYLADFGQNIAGVVRLVLPKALAAGQEIVIRHMEFLKEDGTLFMENLRGAKATDTYIAAGDERDLALWQPKFVYHGFRYAEISGLPLVEKEQLCAVAVYTDLDTKSRFSSGSPMLNRIQELVLQTERANMHSILTDCPQRDERMGWMNDATVRFEETPYNFEIGRIFPKITQDLIDAQDEDGSIACTAPFLYGKRPADPVCSAYLVAGLQALLHTGNLTLIQKAYDGYCAWQRCLERNSEDHIITYSHYGDWAGPAYACRQGSIGDGAVSMTVPGVLMSTGYYYYNAKLLADFAFRLGKAGDAKRYEEDAKNIQAAFLAKWYEPDTARVYNGAQGCQAFSLWLGILPEDGRAAAAKVMRDDLAQNDYRITTGNLCTRYLLDMLMEYGYEDDFYALLTKDTYPSVGYMIQNEATTVWERFELKKNTGMNSHNHPMYGALGYCFYRYLAGISPKGAGYSTVEINPRYPKGLLSVNATLETVKGDISVRWVKQFGACRLFVNVPFNVTAHIHTPSGISQCGSGFWHFEWAESENENQC